MYSSKKQINNHIYLNHYTLKIHTLYISSIASNIGKLQLKGSKAYDGISHRRPVPLLAYTIQKLFPSTGNKILRSKKIHFLLQEKNFLAAKKNFPRSKKQNSAQQGKKFRAARKKILCSMNFSFMLHGFSCLRTMEFSHPRAMGFSHPHATRLIGMSKKSSLFTHNI